MTTTINMSEEEVDAEIEKMQQQLTLALQQIDENFADCNQNFSKVLAEIDQYGEASQQMRDKSQKWLYFLETMVNSNTLLMSDDETEFSTNRPLIDNNTKDSYSYQARGDITNGALSGSFIGRIRQSLRKPASSLMDTTTSGLRMFNIDNSPSSLSDSSSLNARRTGQRLSPPRIMPMSISSSQLEGTPIREQVILLTENRLRSVGIRSSDSESDGKRSEADGRRVESDGRRESWDATNNMNVDDTESRSKFVKFLADRDHLKDLPEGVAFKEPYLPELSLKRYRPNDEEEEFNRSREHTPYNNNQEEITTYEFSDGIAPPIEQSNEERVHSYYSGSMTDKSSIKEDELSLTTTSIKPAEFDLRYFPEQFRTPPGSIKLRRVFDEFNKRPGTLLTVTDIISFLNDPTIEESHVHIFINLLQRKKFLKQVGDRKAWVIRT